MQDENTSKSDVETHGQNARATGDVVHNWFADRIATYLAGGLDEHDTPLFELHSTECPECAAKLAELRKADSDLRGLFGNVRPSVEFEDRTIRKLREENRSAWPNWKIHPMVRMAAVGVAAALVVGIGGYYAKGLIENGGFDNSQMSASAAAGLPWPSTQPGFKMVAGLDPTYSVAADINPGTVGGDAWGEIQQDSGRQVRLGNSNDHNKDGQNPIGSNGNMFRQGAPPAPVEKASAYRSVNPQVVASPTYASQAGQQENDISEAESRMQAARQKELQAIGSATDAAQQSPVNMGPQPTTPKIKANLQAPKSEGGYQTVAPQAAADSKDFYQPVQTQRGQSNDEMHGVNLAPNAVQPGTFHDQVQGMMRGETVHPSVPLNLPQAADENQPTVTKVYNIRDLLDLPNFAPQASGISAPSLSGGSATGGGGGSATGGGQMGGAANGESEPTVNRQQTLQLIRAHIMNEIAPDSWRETGTGNGSIEDFNQSLIINQTPEVQQRVQALIDKLRETENSGSQFADVPTTGVPGSIGSNKGSSTPAAVASGQPPSGTPAIRVVIRHGEISFEVDSFDSATLQISKIVQEEQGFIATTNSEKLANGKVTGVVTVRVPPEHLDTLVLKLRGLGDLKGQKITADDITKDYTDLQSELKAANAMQDRLLDIIKTGKGEVKDLVEAEKSLGEWREKSEKLQGEINYDNNLAALSTLEITLNEKDIRQAATASETESVNMGIETDDVEKSRTEALKSLDDVHARIVQSDMKQFDAGQLAATIVADVAPDKAGPVLDHLKQLGRVARLDIQRQQSTAPGTSMPTGVAAGVPVQRQDTRFEISLYNLANVAARETTNVSLACEDVESAYHAIINQAVAAGGRVVNSSLNHAKADQTDGTITFEALTEKSDAVLAAVRALGEVMHLTVTENPDVANVTTAKRGFAVGLVSLSAVAPRETISAVLMPSGNVSDAFTAIRAAAQTAGARILTAKLEEQNSQSSSADLVFDVSRTHLDDIETAIKTAMGTDGRTISRQSERSSDTEHTVDSKVQFAMKLASPDALGPRQILARSLAVGDVGTAYQAILSAVKQGRSKIITAKLEQDNSHHLAGTLDVIVPTATAAAVDKAIADSHASEVSRATNQSADLNSTTDQLIELRMTVSDVDVIPPRKTTTMTISASNPENSSADLRTQALAVGGRVVDQSVGKTDHEFSTVVVDVPLKVANDFLNKVRGTGTVNSIEQTQNPAVPDSDIAKARLAITIAGESELVGQDAGIWSSFKSGLGISIKGLLYSVQYIIIGVCLIVPWAFVVWAGWKIWKRRPKPI